MIDYLLTDFSTLIFLPTMTILIHPVPVDSKQYLIS